MVFALCQRLPRWMKFSPKRGTSTQVQLGLCSPGWEGKTLRFWGQSLASGRTSCWSPEELRALFLRWAQFPHMWVSTIATTCLGYTSSALRGIVLLRQLSPCCRLVVASSLRPHCPPVPLVQGCRAMWENWPGEGSRARPVRL